MDTRQLQIPPPKNWQDFEDLIQALFKAIWNDPLAQKNGRSGQPQHGVDVFGSPAHRYGVHHGVQCKGKDQAFGAPATLAELRDELAKAEQFEPSLEQWIYATTAPVDQALQAEARRLSAERATKGQFTVTALGWQEIEQLLCEHPKVLAQFYPGQAFDVPALLTSLKAIAASASPQPVSGSVDWAPVRFDPRRDLGPALLGRALGPADAAACPRLSEADLAVAELEVGYAVRLVGEPGSGKSICAYQAAETLAAQGWNVVRLTDPRAAPSALDAGPGKTLFLIDDAHLTSASLLRQAEDAAGSDRLLLSTHSAQGQDPVARGAIAIDRARAVRTIAAALRRDSTLAAVVRRLDNHVGDGIGDEDLQYRIDAAETAAEYPWQFCFILGGGWRRAEQSATNARLAGADLVLAAAAVRQLASRDARPELAELQEISRAAGIGDEASACAVAWLCEERLLIGPGDLRCPHQRFASVVLFKILEGQTSEGQAQIGAMLRHVLASPIYPLAGISVLLGEVRSGSGGRRWAHLAPPDALAPLIARCWKSVADAERGAAALIFATLEGFLPNWPTALLEGREDKVADWLSQPTGGSAYGLARLLHALWRDEAAAERVLHRADACAMARAISSVTSEDAFELGELASAVRPLADNVWARTYRSSLDHQALRQLAAKWPSEQPLFRLINLCKAVVWADESLGLDMVEAFLPQAQAELANDPVESFHELQDVAWHVLRVFDPLGAYAKRYPPGPRHRALAGQMLSRLDPIELARRLSAARLREFQQVSFLLAFARIARPRLFRAALAALDWARLSETIGDRWDRLPHDAEVLLGVAYDDGRNRAAIEAVVAANLHRITSLPARIAMVAPAAAETYFDQGGLIAIGAGDHVEWLFGAAVIAHWAERRPDQVERLLEPSLQSVAKALSRAHLSFYDEAGVFLQILQAHAPGVLQRVLDSICVETAAVGWLAALKGKAATQQAAAVLVEAGLARTDAAGDLARRLRKQFPRASRPT
ncbi:hypothetical protein [Phenylobacterium sp.]|uniref:nSTAND3 domain-containing NTPase n=1 Tax=Phenylobacterium sp. TaxID=1871053 RepID=UPI0035B18344